MSIITFTSDLGQKEFYTGIIKGAILSKCPGAQIIDITHNILPFDIVQAAYILKHSFKSFPKGTIHLINVDNSNRRPDHFISFVHDGHFFVGPNNGLFSLALEEKPSQAFSVPYSKQWRFPLKELFAIATEHLTKNKPLAEIGPRISSLKTRISLQPVTTQTTIQGHVAHIDHYGNAQLNVHHDLFERIAQDRPYRILFKNHLDLHLICQHYSDVPVGDALCCVSSTGYLEIAVNMGRAADLLSLKVDDTILIVFSD